MSILSPNYLGNNTYGSSRGSILQRQPEVMNVHNLFQQAINAGQTMTSTSDDEFEQQAMDNEMIASTLLGEKNEKKRKKQVAWGQEPVGESPDRLRQLYDRLLGIESYY